MTKQQELKIEKIRKFVLEYDCYQSSEDYEIKRFDIEEREFGLVWLVIICGMKNDASFAAILSRKYRHIAIGPRGGVFGFKYDAKGNRKKFSGWINTMYFGYSN